MKAKRRFWCSAGTWSVTALTLAAAAVTAPACSEAFTCSDRRTCEPGGAGGAGAGGANNGPAAGAPSQGGAAGEPVSTGGTNSQAGSGGALATRGGATHTGTTGGANDSDAIGGDDSVGGSIPISGDDGESANGGTTSAGATSFGGKASGGAGGTTNPCAPPASGPAQCSAQCPCTVGAGQCINHSGCSTGLVCGVNAGAKFGFSGNTCLPKHCDNDVLDADETSIDCGGDCGCRAEFMRLGGAPSTASDVNRDGTVIVGASNSKAYRWAESTGMEVLLNDLAGPGGSYSASVARAIASSGSLIVGNVSTGTTPTPFQWRWPSMTLLSTSSSVGLAFGVSGDGSTIVGQQALHEAIIWRGSTTSTFGHSVSNTGSGAQAAISASEDGSVVVGYAFNPSGLERAVVAENGSEYALSPLGGIAATHANSVSRDGSVIVGWGASSTDDSLQAYRWTRTGAGQYTAERLGDLEGGTLTSEAVDVNADGSVVVGYGTTANGKEPFLWDKPGGMRRLADDLASRGFEWPATTPLGTVAAISADGTTIVGAYTNPVT